MASDEENLKPFRPLGDYNWPIMPTEETVRRFYNRIVSRFRSIEEHPIIADAQLERASADTLDDVVGPPACGQLLAELDLTLSAWVSEDKPKGNIRFIVLPPGDENDLLASWAKSRKFTIVKPPSRKALLSGSEPKLPDFSDGGKVAIPGLEYWFLRHRSGLRHIRELLKVVAAADGHVLIGCNSWAWQFLKKSVEAQMILPEPLMFQAFDADRLDDWFSQLAHGDDDEALTLRFAGSGSEVFRESDDADEPQADYFHKLAAQSYGIPWVAWRLWRSSLRRGSPDEENAGRSEEIDSDQTLWVAALDEYTLPDADQQTALLVLHALLLHGTLSAEELRLIIPVTGETNVVSALLNAGFVARQKQMIRCLPAAYPSIRKGLSGAGFPTDRL